MRSSLPIVLFVLLAFVAGPAWAEDKKKANELAEQAVAAFSNGDFEAAAKLFGDAYEQYNQQSLKLNEMIAWYKAEQCTPAVEVAESLNGQELTDDDGENVDRVLADCGYRDARAKFEAGDLDGAEAALQDLPDGDSGRAIGTLQKEIEVKRQELANAETPIEPPPTVDPVDPAPKWALWTGIGLTSVGGGLGIGTVIKWLVERSQLEDGYNVIADDYGCTYSLKTNDFSGDMCNQPAMQADPRYDKFKEEQVDAATKQNIQLGVTAGVVGAAGVGVLVYYFILDAKHAKYEKSQMTLLPDLRPGHTGAVFQLTF